MFHTLVQILDRRLGLTAAHIDVAGSYTPATSPGNLGTEMTGLGHELQAGFTKLADSPAVYHGVEDCLEVTQPQCPDADGVKGRAEVEASTEHGQQTHHRMWQPAHGEANEQDEDSGEGPGFKTHVHVDLGSLQTGQTQLADMVNSNTAFAGVIVDAQRIASNRVENTQIGI